MTDYIQNKFTQAVLRNPGLRAVLTRLRLDNYLSKVYWQIKKTKGVPDYELDGFSEDRYPEVVISEVLRYIPPVTKVLDLGCGTGRALKCFTQKNPAAGLTGVDISASMLARAREVAPRADFFQIDLESPKWPEFCAHNSGQYDLVYSYGVLQYLRQAYVSRFFKLTRQLLKKDGHIAVVFALKSAEDQSRIGYTRYTLGEIEQILKESGSRIVKSSTIINETTGYVLVKV